MESIGTLGKIKITENGMIANIVLDDTKRNIILHKYFILHSKLDMLNFEYIKFTILAKDNKKAGNLETAKMFENAKPPLKKEINKLNKKISILAKFL